MASYLDRLFYERYKQWKRDLHKHYELFNAPEVALEEGYSLELEDLPDEWAWLCSHFEDPNYVKKAKVNKINQDKKTHLHHSGGSKFPEIDIFKDVYVGMSLPCNCNRRWWRGPMPAFRSLPLSFPRTLLSSLWLYLRMQGFIS